MESVKDRFLRYVKMDTQSQQDVEEVPSTDKQFSLALALSRELQELGAEDVLVSDHCYVTASIPANNERIEPVIGLIAHMDTSDAVSGENVRPVITEKYDGGEISMSEGYTLSPEEFPHLLRYVGDDIICSDGTTLLGADDKAGVAEIMTVVERLCSPGAPLHGPIRVCFTPDEEVGRGVDFFSVKDFHGDFAYTVDGGGLGELNYENFNAASGDIRIRGVSIHTGSAKGKMINASLVAMELHEMLPAFMNPAVTEGREGFFHLDRMQGQVEEAELHYLIRDHDFALFTKKKELLQNACDYMNEKYGPGTVTAAIRDTYYNMKERIPPILVERAVAAMEAVGITPDIQPIRGGTDGARLSFMGLPCPNLCTGGHNFHGRYEFISIQAMEKVVEMLLALVSDSLTKKA